MTVELSRLNDFRTGDPIALREDLQRFERSVARAVAELAALAAGLSVVRLETNASVLLKPGTAYFFNPANTSGGSPLVARLPVPAPNDEGKLIYIGNFNALASAGHVQIRADGDHTLDGASGTTLSAAATRVLIVCSGGHYHIASVS